MSVQNSQDSMSYFFSPIKTSPYRTVFLFLLQKYLCYGLLRFSTILEFRPYRLGNSGHFMIFITRTAARVFGKVVLSFLAWLTFRFKGLGVEEKWISNIHHQVKRGSGVY